MLPDFPKLKAEVHRDVLARIRRRADSADSVVSQIKRLSQHEGRDMRYDRIDAPPVESGPEELGVRFEVLVSEVPDLIGPKLDAKIEEIAQEIAKQQAKMFFRRVGETCDEIGNTINANGQPLSAELMLEMFSNAQLNFGPDGRPTGQFVIHPDMAPAMKRADEELERDPELRRRFEDILRRKREEWATRESHRKLAD
jgi:hypothetical protein